MKRFLFVLFAFALGTKLYSADLFEFAPDNLDVYYFSDMKKIHKTKYSKQYLNFIQSMVKIPFLNIEPESSFDIYTNIEAIFVGVIRNKPKIVAIEGSYDKKKLVSFFVNYHKFYKKKFLSSRKNSDKKNKTKKEKIKIPKLNYKFREFRINGKSVISLPYGGYLMFYSDKILLWGYKTWLKKAVSGKKFKDSGDFKKLYPLITKKDAPVYWLSKNRETTKKKLLKRGLKSLAMVVGTVGIATISNDSFDVNGIILCKDEKNCSDVKKLIQKKIDKMKDNSTLKFMGITSFFTGLRMEQKKNLLILKEKLNQFQINLLFNVASKLLLMMR